MSENINAAAEEIRDHASRGYPVTLTPADVKKLKELTGMTLHQLGDRLGLSLDQMRKRSAGKEAYVRSKIGRPDLRIAGRPDSICATLDTADYCTAILKACAEGPLSVSDTVAADHLVGEHLDGFLIKKASTLYDANGEIKLRWIQHQKEEAKKAEALELAVEALRESIPRAAPEPAPRQARQDLLSCYVLSDLHLGMMAWAPETGADYDLKIAEDLVVRWFERVIATQQPGTPAVLGQLGDFLHWDGLDAVTPTHGHVLDADTRFQRLVSVAIRVIRRVISMLLVHHSSVHVVWAEGNHDMASSVFMREMLAAFYDEEPRLTVDTSADIYYCLRHGKTALYFHHGHKARPAQVAQVMASKFRETFGACPHGYCHLGHLHHTEREKENGLMTVEQHRTLAASDAHASRGGYISGRSASVITYHKEYGEVSRSTVSAEAVLGEQQ